MSNSTLDFTESEASTNSTAVYFNPIDMLDIFNLVFAFPVYSWVIWLIVTGTGSGVASELFMLSLSVCEIGNCLNSLLSTLRILVSFFVSSFFLELGITGRALFQCLICVERYLAVVHPVTFLKYKPLRYRVICCAASWIVTLASCLCLVFIFKLDIAYLCFILLQFLLFFSIQLFCLVAVLRALKQSGPGERGRERKRKEENHMKKRAFYLILITTVNVAVIYVPLAISLLLSILNIGIYEDSLTVGLYCYIFAGLVQPVLYLKRVGKMSCLCFQKKK